MGTIVSYFDDFHDALNTSDSIQIKNRILPRSLEFMDAACIASLKEGPKVAIPEGAKSLLLIDVDGNEKNVTNAIAKIEDICKENNALKSEVAKTAEERETLWEMIRSVPPSLFKTATMKFNDDFCVPRSKVRDILEKVYDLSRAASVKVAAFGHIGEGHINLSVIYDDGSDKEHSVHTFVSEVLKEVVSIGGTITSELGVGDAKAEYVKLELTAQEIELMQELKKLFDPKGIMNPGKIFV